MSLSSNLSAARRLYDRDGLVPVLSRALEKTERAAGSAAPEPYDRLTRMLSVREIRRRQRGERDLEDVLDTAYGYRGFGAYRSLEPMQVREELRAFVRAVAATDPDTVCEIGTARGGTYYVWTRCLNAETFASVDFPGGQFGGGHSTRRAEFLAACAAAGRSGLEQHFVRGDSHDPETVRRVKEAFDGDPVDYLFIDGDHTYEGVKEDFERFSPLVAEGGLVAFHDIVEHTYDPDCEVDRFWRELREDDAYETREIIADPDQERGGVGLVYL
jgi:cephalosporin hydroxylase